MISSVDCHMLLSGCHRNDKTALSILKLNCKKKSAVVHSPACIWLYGGGFSLQHQPTTVLWMSPYRKMPLCSGPAPEI